MSENRLSEPQFVGQADATRPMSEVPPKEEVVLNAEQKQVVDVMQAEGAKFETAELAAREKAAGGLKALYGKELVEAGLKQMGYGILYTTASAAIGYAVGLVGGGLGGGVVGGVAGGTLGAIADLSIDSALTGAATFGTAGVAAGSAIGKLTGLLTGFETAGLAYNKVVASKKQQPPVRWYDWVISNVGLVPIVSHRLKIPFINKVPVLREINQPRIMAQFINPITIAGVRNVVTGLWQMRTPQRA